MKTMVEFKQLTTI
jgi:hypothetical protein